ncbi:nitrile hydratase accessory protein [Nodosilinea sp. P-1105]|uniref:nitrile hydratase accessory protein n=1 Tax=Nodosilinea sp. P-1105 TaxID=2546229 RepID=UPI00146E657E|nr:nitrile hydratase accessory protein [Nodosilinea sp. P-1105]NMF85038.1 nitrile hydratase accessory protein [Nodosilinea sp. P-1105]
MKLPQNFSSSASYPMSNLDKEPVFKTPWEARAFAIVNQLATLEHCTWPEWTQYLSSEIKATEQVNHDTDTYYEQWVGACEKLLVDKGLLDIQAIHTKINELRAEQKLEHGH